MALEVDFDSSEKHQFGLARGLLPLNTSRIAGLQEGTQKAGSAVALDLTLCIKLRHALGMSDEIQP